MEGHLQGMLDRDQRTAKLRFRERRDDKVAGVTEGNRSREFASHDAHRNTPVSHCAFPRRASPYASQFAARKKGHIWNSIQSKFASPLRAAQARVSSASSASAASRHTPFSPPICITRKGGAKCNRWPMARCGCPDTIKTYLLSMCVTWTKCVCVCVHLAPRSLLSSSAFSEFGIPAALSLLTFFSFYAQFHQIIKR